MGFIFRFANILKIRESQRDVCRVTLEEAQREEEALCADYQECERLFCDTVKKKREFLTSGQPAIHTLQQIHSCLAHLQVQRDRAKYNYARAQEKTSQLREELLKADREVKMLEKLSDRYYQEYLQTQLEIEKKAG